MVTKMRRLSALGNKEKQKALEFTPICIFSIADVDIWP